MRYPVFTRPSNAAIDRPILRKSLTYVTLQVASGLADWIDASNPSKGIVARGMLYFGPRHALAVEAETAPTAHGGWLKWVPPGPRPAAFPREEFLRQFLCRAGLARRTQAGTDLGLAVIARLQAPPPVWAPSL